MLFKLKSFFYFQLIKKARYDAVEPHLTMEIKSLMPYMSVPFPVEGYSILA